MSTYTLIFNMKIRLSHEISDEMTPLREISNEK